ncbi:MAG: ATP-binding protein [Anaerolineales bacterium]
MSTTERRNLLDSKMVSWMMNISPISWLTEWIVRRWMRRRISDMTFREATLERAAAVGLEAMLQSIVTDVVDVLGYTGAMVATYEHGDALPVRAFYVDPRLASSEDIARWERQISGLVGRNIRITDAQTARVYIYEEKYAGNLSVRAAKAGGPVLSDELYDLFRPIAPPASRSIVRGIQRALGIRQVIAVPFFLEAEFQGRATREMVGNLFAAKRTRISEPDQLLLSAFGRQAAAAIDSERRRLQIEIAQKMTYRVQTSLHDEKEIYKWIAKGIVADLGYVGAMVAPYERDGSMPVQALCLDPAYGDMNDIRRWEQQLSRVIGEHISVDDPDTSRVYVHQPAYKDNLSVRAVKAGAPVTSDALYDLFRPVAPLSAQHVVQSIQRTLGIQQVIAAPFFLETVTEAGETERELVGNLFAATRSQTFKPSEIALLEAFAQQAAAGIRNARLYRQAEEQRMAAQMFGKMAFSAATAVHEMRNHIGVFRVYLSMLQSLPPEEALSQLERAGDVQTRLDQTTEILDTLGEPWRRVIEQRVDVNICVRNALERLDAAETADGAAVVLDLTEAALPIKTSADMLTEAFRVLIKNAIEAVEAAEAAEAADAGEAKARETGEVRIVSRRAPASDEMVITVADTGVGIPRQHLHKIFEIGWSSKDVGMGFGLFWTRDYVHGLGGHIDVESEAGEGTTFTVRLPLADEREQEVEDV